MVTKEIFHALYFLIFLAYKRDKNGKKSFLPKIFGGWFSVKGGKNA